MLCKLVTKLLLIIVDDVKLFSWYAYLRSPLIVLPACQDGTPTPYSAWTASRAPAAHAPRCRATSRAAASGTRL